VVTSYPYVPNLMGPEGMQHWSSQAASLLGPAGELEALYLAGSASLDAFSPTGSDLDLVATTSASRDTDPGRKCQWGIAGS
jgi:hypothetical protein